jgi:uncharacterized protein DUF3347
MTIDSDAFYLITLKKPQRMRKVLLSIILLFIAAFIIYEFLWKNRAKREHNSRPLTIGKNSAVFNESFDKLLTSYFNLKNAFVERDTVKVNYEAQKMAFYADSLKVDEIKGDSLGLIKETAQTYTGVIVGSATALAGEREIEDKLKEFEMLSDAIWTLMRTVKYGGQKVYYQYCPMAFNNKGAYWISNTLQIRNPYFGAEMLECGNVADSLDYRNK